MHRRHTICAAAGGVFKQNYLHLRYSLSGPGGGRTTRTGQTILKIIPAIDLKDGCVVHARGGDRRRYRPLELPLFPSAQPLDVIARLLDGAAPGPPDTVYVADLDAIAAAGKHDGDDDKTRADANGENRAADDSNNRDNAESKSHTADGNNRADAGGNNHADDDDKTRAAASAKNRAAIAGIRSRFPALRVWLDSGVRRRRDIAGVPPGGQLLPVVGTETLADDLSLFNDTDYILSLDFDAKRPPDGGLLRRPQAWPHTVIALMLARVGAQCGPDIARLKPLRARHRGRLIAGGGVRDERDLRELQACGVDGALAATAIYHGRLRRAG